MSRKHSIVIGGTKGVGRELASLLAAGGQNVTAVGRASIAFTGSAAEHIESFIGDVEDAEGLLRSLIRQVEVHGAISSLVFLQRYRGNGDSWTGEIARAAEQAPRYLVVRRFRRLLAFGVCRDHGCLLQVVCCLPRDARDLAGQRVLQHQ